MGRLSLAMAFGALLALACASGALAHASLVSVEPADGSVLTTAPRAFVLRFNEPISPLVLKLVQPDGSSVALPRFMLRGTTLDIAAPGALGNGTHVLSWRVVSEDGHPVGGSAVFSIGASSAGGGHLPAEAIDRPVRTGIWLAKVLLYAGLFFGVGGAFFMCWIGGRFPPAPAGAASAIAAGLVAAVASVGLQGLDALGLPLSGLEQWSAWTAGFSTSYGTTAAIATAALVAGLASLRASRPIAKALSLAGFVAVGLALSASGHAGAAHPQWLTRPAVLLHGLGIAFWAGSLLPLGTALARPAPDTRAVLLRFSRTIPFAIAPLVAAGIALALVQLRSVDALWTTAYGQVLLVKLGLLVALFSLAATNRLWLTAPSARGDGQAIRRLRNSIRGEIALVALVLAVAAVWRFTPPPRTLMEAAAAPAFAHIHTAKAIAEVTITPGHTGRVNATIAIMAGDFGPMQAKEVTLILSNSAAGIEAIRRPATEIGGGTWRVDDLDVPLAGKWSARIDILVSDFALVKLEGPIEIRP